MRIFTMRMAEGFYFHFMLEGQRSKQRHKKEEMCFKKKNRGCDLSMSLQHCLLKEP